MPQVKEESQPDFSSLFSPPASPFIPAPSSQPIRQRTTKSESPRTRPYPELHRTEEIGMSGTSGSGYDNWSGRSSRSNVERRSSDGDSPLYQTTSYDHPNSVVQLSRSSSASAPSSSFSGAVESEPHSRFASLSPRHVDNQMGSMSWHQSQMALSGPSDLSMYPGVAGDNSYHLPSNANYGGFTSSGAAMSSAVYPYDMTNTPATGYAPHDSPPHSPTNDDLHRRLAELEQRHRRDKEQICALQSQLAGSSSGYSMPTSVAFEASWKARTDARTRQFCSLNRAGNALCAWHDSRRERRVYPPRMAPFGTLNCGCTYEEALFEESLSRHNVGSYLPGENTRMDPALRNPLLKLLQQRYGYRDGDFERDPTTGNWIPGEGPTYWEQRAASGVNPRRQSRVDQHR